MTKKDNNTNKNKSNQKKEEKKDNSKDDNSKDDNSKDDNSKDDNSKDDNSKDDNSKNDNSKNDNSKNDNSKNDNSKDDNSKDDYPFDDYPFDDYPFDDYPFDDYPFDDYPIDDEPIEDDLIEDDKKNEDSLNNDKKDEDSTKIPITSIILIIDNNENNNIDEKNDKTYDDLDDDSYYNDLNNINKNNDKKRKNELNNNIDSFFKEIIGNINKKKNKKLKKDEIDEFKDYFKESDKLLPINVEIKSLDDLINLGKKYNPHDKNRYVINLRALNKCVEPLIELNNMIGMKNIKEMIIDLIFFRLQNLEDNKEELWHLVIQGTPGSGKTEVAKIIGKLYYSLGITKKDKFTLVKRSELIGKYLGHTAKLTQEVFDNAKGGILFIDEAYSLGNPEQRDSFSKECIDTINQNLTENKETVVFIAGYKDQLNESFFSYNPGLNRRFKMRLTVDKYNGKDLREIYLKKIKENTWSILDNNTDKEIPLSFFEKNISTFKYNGGDMENLWHFTKIVHARRIFGKSHDLMKKITKADLDNAYKLYCENEEVKSRTEDLSKYIFDTMYV
jgi:hypothetical protein